MKLGIPAWLSLALILATSGYGSPCAMEMKVSGTVSAGVIADVGLRICGADQNQSKVDVTWNGDSAVRKIPRTRIQDYLKASALAEKELKGLPARAGRCLHGLTIEMKRESEVPVRFFACERTVSHLVGRKLISLVRDAHFSEETKK